MACPNKPIYLSWRDYCRAYPGCPGCFSIGSANTPNGSLTINIGGANGGTPSVQYPADQLRMLLDGTWELLSADEHAALQQDLAEFEADLPAQGVEREMALAIFYADRGIDLMRIASLDKALSFAKNESRISIATELASALGNAGFHEAALTTWNVVPSLTHLGNPSAAEILGDVEINRGRLFQSMGRIVEADSAFAKARHMIKMSGRIAP